MKKKLLLVVLLGVVLASLSMAQTPPNVAEKEHSLSLEKLSGIRSVTISGQKPDHTFYFPIPEDWDVNEIKIQFSLKKSPLLVAPSTLSLLVNNTPLDSIRLDQAGDQSFLWQVSIPKRLINKKNIDVQLAGYLVLTDKVCQDIQNKANWVVVNSDSKVSYHYRLKPQPLNFDKINHLFLEKNSLVKDRINFIFPEHSGPLTLAPMMQLSQYFGKLASWRGIQFNVFHSLAETAGIDGNFILIAKSGDYDFSFLNGSIPLSYSNQQWVDEQGSALPPGQGFLLLIKNPGNPSRNLLVISANDEQGLITAVSQIILRNFKLMLKKGNFLIAEKRYQPDIPQFPDKKEMTLTQLGYSDQIIYGDGLKKFSYQFELPVEYAGKQIEFTVYYSHSPFLSDKSTSSLALVLNGLPINGGKLEPGNAQIRALRFVLPVQYFKVGLNSIDLDLSLKLDQQACSRYAADQAWAVIYDSSFFSLTLNHQPLDRRLNMYPYFLDGIVTIGLPIEQEFYDSDEFVKHLINFAASLKQSRYLDIRANDQLNRTDRKNMIYIGSASHSNSFIDYLSGYLKRMATSISKSNSRAFQSINTKVLTHLFDSKGVNIGFGFLLPASKDSHYSSLLLVGNNARHLNQILSLLSSTRKRTMLNGDMTIAFEDGTFTTLISEEINKALVKEVKIKQVGDRVLAFILYGLLGLVVIIMVILLARRAAKND